MALERIQKIIAQAGIASRRASERIITDGRVRVNGRVIRVLGSKADPEVDRIEVEGHGVLSKEPRVYLLLHKPPLVVSTVADPEGRTTVVDLLARSTPVGGRGQSQASLPRVYPVGRLDYDAEGLLLLTNDGDLTSRLLHPRHHVPKTYMVRVRGIPTKRELEQLQAGVVLQDEATGRRFRTGPAEASLVKTGATNAWVELTIFEGRYHQVKRMMEAIRHPVARLIRTHFGGIELGELPVGGWRSLTKAEVAHLQRWEAAPGAGTTTGGRPAAAAPVSEAATEFSVVNP